mmetsp:Transcript_16883/g.39449  ORF Transcript_16883/g.39449 Transcript_16883/m.39449 type:complete len:316 (+) Transcript_16883:611-1558(+)
MIFRFGVEGLLVLIGPHFFVLGQQILRRQVVMVVLNVLDHDARHRLPAERSNLASRIITRAQHPLCTRVVLEVRKVDAHVVERLRRRDSNVHRDKHWLRTTVDLAGVGVFPSRRVVRHEIALLERLEVICELVAARALVRAPFVVRAKSLSIRYRCEWPDDLVRLRLDRDAQVCHHDRSRVGRGGRHGRLALEVRHRVLVEVLHVAAQVGDVELHLVVHEGVRGHRVRIVHESLAAVADLGRADGGHEDLLDPLGRDIGTVQDRAAHPVKLVVVGRAASRREVDLVVAAKVGAVAPDRLHTECIWQKVAIDEVHE